jgi:hypothetical protein
MFIEVVSFLNELQKGSMFVKTFTTSFSWLDNSDRSLHMCTYTFCDIKFFFSKKLEIWPNNIFW